VPLLHSGFGFCVSRYRSGFRFRSPGLDSPREVSQAHARSSAVKLSSLFSSLGTAVVRLLQVIRQASYVLEPSDPSLEFF
jgi:hypothetical protein